MVKSTNFKLDVSEKAVAKISSVLKNKSRESFFRIVISSGGCAGFSTSFLIDENIEDEDIVIEKQDIKIVINEQIADFIKEAELIYNTDIISSYFQLNVKTAKTQCSCGSSFSL